MLDAVWTFLSHRRRHLVHGWASRLFGAGLGLGGAITVESVGAPGSWFRCAIPAAPATPMRRRTASMPAAPRIPALHILVAEDNRVNQMIVEAMLSRAGHRVTVVGNGVAAVAAVGGAAFDLVLMDISMPGLDGLQATRRIRSLPDARRAIPIIALTANAMEGDRETFLAAGMNDTVTKPITAETLHAAIARTLPAPAGAFAACG